MVNDIHVYVNEFEQLREIVSLNKEYIKRIYVNSSLAYEHLDYISEYPNYEFYFATPYVFRKKDVNKFSDIIKTGLFKGVLVRNLEVYSYLNINYESFMNIDIVLDSQMYVLNSESLKFYIENSNIPIKEYYSSFELNEKELKRLICNIVNEGNDNIIHSSVVYGRIPMMITANCIRKTLDKCTGNSGFYEIEDRKNKSFPIYCNCEHCYNVVYNSVPLSLHKYVNELKKNGNIRLDFVDEKAFEMKKIINYYIGLMSKYEDPFYKDYTTGHYKRGVE